MDRQQTPVRYANRFVSEFVDGIIMNIQKSSSWPFFLRMPIVKSPLFSRLFGNPLNRRRYRLHPSGAVKTVGLWDCVDRYVRRCRPEVGLVCVCVTRSVVVAYVVGIGGQRDEGLTAESKCSCVWTLLGRFPPRARKPVTRRATTTMPLTWGGVLRECSLRNFYIGGGQSHGFVRNRRLFVVVVPSLARVPVSHRCVFSPPSIDDSDNRIIFFIVVAVCACTSVSVNINKSIFVVRGVCYCFRFPHPHHKCLLTFLNRGDIVRPTSQQKDAAVPLPSSSSEFV